MARSSGSHLPPNFQRRAFYGIANFTTWKGQQVVRAWPRKRPGPGTPAQQDARDNFKHMVNCVKDMMAEDHAMARELARGSGYTWRDVLSAHVTGGYVNVEGLEMLSTQAALDMISSEPGAMLFRAADAWVAVLPGLEGEVLTLAGGFPEWQTPAAPSGSGGWVNAAIDASPTLTFNSTTRSFLGPALSADDGDLYDVIAIGKKINAIDGIGITVTNPAGTAGYLWDIQGDGNNVLYRGSSGGLTVLRASGTSGTTDAGVYIHARMMIGFTINHPTISPIGITPLMDHSGADFHTTGIKFGVYCYDTAVPIKLLYKKVSAVT